MRHCPRPLFATVLWAAAGLQAQEAPPALPTTPEVSPQAVFAACGGPVRGVRVLRDATGAVGGYVAVPAIMDSPIAYRDAAGQLLTVFHIFDSDANKAAAAAIVQRLTQAFPREEFLTCPPTGR